MMSAAPSQASIMRKDESIIDLKVITSKPITFKSEIEAKIAKMEPEPVDAPKPDKPKKTMVRRPDPLCNESVVKYFGW